MHRRTCNYALLSALQADCLFCTSQIPPSSATRLGMTLCTCVPNFRVGDAATKKWPREQNLRQNTVLLSFFGMQKTSCIGVIQLLAKRNHQRLPPRLPIVPAAPRGGYVRSLVKRCAGSAGRRCRRCARGQHGRVGWHAKQAAQQRRGTAMQGCDSAKTGKGGKAGNAPTSPRPNKQKP